MKIRQTKIKAIVTYDEVIADVKSHELLLGKRKTKITLSDNNPNNRKRHARNEEQLKSRFNVAPSINSSTDRYPITTFVM